ncbi:MAG: Imm63 family immunity protein, partial [Candidatus Lokiarchaeota archaeon]
DVHKLLYWIFKDIVFEMASDYELNHRKPEEDFRKLLFNKDLALFEKLDNQWYVWEKEDIDNILKENPYEP